MNTIEIPLGQTGQNMTGTGWYNIVTLGQRNGTFNPDFADKSGKPLGDPYGSMAVLSVVVPNRINDGSTIPAIQILMDGLRINQFDASGNSLGESFSNNPAWVILDSLLRIGWSLTEMDLAAFSAAAAYCQEAIQATDLFGNAVMTPRFQCNVIIKNRRTAADVIRGIRNANRLLLRYGSSGLLQLIVENSVALQQPVPGIGSNAAVSLNGGWPAYEFGDGTSGTTGIARTSSGASSVKLVSKASADTPNRFVAEFQDAFNEFQQDSLSIVDADDVARTGQEITSNAPVLGLPHFDQAARILKFYLDKSVGSNTAIEFQTSIKALGLSPGDIISVTYLKEGFERQPFRVSKIQPGTNYRTAILSAQIHDDQWYLDTNGQTRADASRRQAAFSVGVPRALAGVIPVANGALDFGVVESVSQTPDGAVAVTATVSFSAPLPGSKTGPNIPLLSLAPTLSQTGGSLAGGQSLYYAVTALDADSAESGLSFLVRASLPAGTTTYTVSLTGLSFPAAATAFQVYRGLDPGTLFQIAANQKIAPVFLDSGLTATPVLPPDRNFDHADFYWRLELQPPTNATTYSSSTIGSSILQMIVGTYSGMVVRIIAGVGAGQERTITANTASVLNVTPDWDLLPDSTSEFVVAQGTYQFGAIVKASPVQFTIPNQAGNVIQISGRSANCNGVEAPYEVSPLTRWTIGGAGMTNVDAAPPAAPAFGLSVNESAGGSVLFGALGFNTLSNLTTVTAGTYRLFYLDELNPGSLASLAVGIGPLDTQVVLSASVAVKAPSRILVDSEILGVVQISTDGVHLGVTRGLHGTQSASHMAGAPAFEIGQQIFVVPFPKSFFGSPASGDWTYPVSFPNVRIISAELVVTNSQGSSPAATLSFTGLQDGGLRTLSGGQFSFQVGGFLAVQTGAAPDIIIDAPKVVRDVYAVVKQAPSGAPIQIAILLNGNPYCSLTIPDGAGTVTSAVDGVSLPPMKYRDRLSLNITGVGRVIPGSGLTVIIRV